MIHFFSLQLTTKCVMHIPVPHSHNTALCFFFFISAFTKNALHLPSSTPPLNNHNTLAPIVFIKQLHAFMITENNRTKHKGFPTHCTMTAVFPYFFSSSWKLISNKKNNNARLVFDITRNLIPCVWVKQQQYEGAFKSFSYSSGSLSVGFCYNYF